MTSWSVWIGYAGWLRWGTLQISFASSLSSKTRTSLRGCEEPRVASGRLDWSCEAIGVRHLAAAQAGGRLAPPQELCPGVTWQCVAPAADVTVTLRDREIQDRDYAEVLEMSVPPGPCRFVSCVGDAWPARRPRSRGFNGPAVTR